LDTPAPPRIPVLVVTTAKAGGAERAVEYLVQQLPGLGFEPTLLLLEPGPLEGWLAAAGVTSVVAASSRREVPRQAQRLVEETRARLVLSSKWHAHRYGGAAAHAAGIPAVFWQHDIAKPTLAQIKASLVPAQAIVCPSLLAIEAQRWLTPEAETVQIYPGVPVGALAARATRAPLDRSRIQEPLVGILGRLSAFKGQHVFLEAAALVLRRRPDVRFVVVGGPVLDEDHEYVDRLHRLALDFGLADRLQFVGHQPDVVPWLNALDVAVHATGGEPFGLVLIEAMALGTPVIATDLGGPSEIIEHGRSGWLVPVGRPHAMAEAILRVLDDAALRDRLSTGGAQRASRFTVERMSAAFASLFDSVLTRSQSRPPRAPSESAPL
jgi:glycosyltransferase involved in cell wall biosynthesis